MTRKDLDSEVIAALIDELDAAKALIGTLTDACDVYRLIALAACARLHAHHLKQQRLTARLEALRDEIRRYTAAMTFEKAA